MVTLGSTTLACASLVCLYFGRKTVTSWPSAASACGNAPTTSARPPVLENGTHSDAAKVIFIRKPPVKAAKGPQGEGAVYCPCPRGSMLVAVENREESEAGTE